AGFRFFPNMQKAQRLIHPLPTSTRSFPGKTPSYGDGTIQLELRDQYYNMKEKLEDKMYIVERAFNAMKAVGVEPHIKPIRGGTDGARLSFMGLPCPNIFTGGDNYHGRYEYISVNSMKKAVEVIVKIAQI
ncbi:MAG: pepT, partial [Defluviitaleaceae bacterium]|nr:pepT [Defluviitaleaceae bacterium]